MNESESSNFQIFRDCLATALVQTSTKDTSLKKRGRNRHKNLPVPEDSIQSENGNADDLADFVDVFPLLSSCAFHVNTHEYIATEIFTSLPTILCTLAYTKYNNSSALQTLYSIPLSPQTTSSLLASLPPEITDSLTTYAFLPPHKTLPEFLTPILTSYIETVTAPPLPMTTQREMASECEICERGWIPLTYHHLIPREVHAKVLKRGWHDEGKLNDAAWLCRACHSRAYLVLFLCLKCFF